MQASFVIILALMVMYFRDMIKYVAECIKGFMYLKAHLLW